MKIILGETLTDNQKLTIILLDEMYVTKIICYDNKNEQIIYIWLVHINVFRFLLFEVSTFYILYLTVNNVICSTRITFLYRSNITMETIIIL